MDAIRQLQTVFHLTGRRPAAGPLEAIEPLGLRPALLARYRDLDRLRYDFPVVLVEPAAGGPFARPLTDIVNALARAAAPAGPPGEALRKQLLHVEADIRRVVAGGASGRLSSLWASAVERLAAADDPQLAEVLRRAGEMIEADGELLGCDERMPAKLLVHAWRGVQREKQARVRAQIDALVMRLDDILRGDFIRSEAGRRPDSLRAAVGTRQQALFDFDAMARLLARGGPESRLSASRRGRIEAALDVLRAQRFFPAPGPLGTDDRPHEFLFGTCRAVRQAFGERLPGMAALVRAMAIAELEAEGLYDEARHDPYFEAFDANSLSPRDLAMFPDYLVCLRGRRRGTSEDTRLLELLSSGIGVKVLVETDDILEEAPVGGGVFAHGVRSAQLAGMAVGLADAFVLQSVSANLPRLHAAIRSGLSAPAPALFCVYTPADTHDGALPAYLVSAAAMQSRAFPAFSYDPAAGPDLASRFSLEQNPQPERDWPVARLEYADAKLQRVSEEIAFTLADFVATDSRYAQHFARVPHAAWNGHMLPMAEWLAREGAEAEHQVPVVAAVDGNDVLQRLVVDEPLVQAARRCLEQWHRLQEFGGIRNSHAERLLARERARWEEERRVELEVLAGKAGAAAAPATVTQAAAEAAAMVAPAPSEAADEEPERSPDEAWIETIRCSSCNECTQINDKMFAYNDNQQAYLRDLSAGTYRQLVEAAESCQLAIIHPGKPLDPTEPGIEELLERAKPFI
jgi:hypothetical protein